MPRKRRTSRRYPRRSFFRRHAPKRFSILTGVGMLAGATVSLNDRYSIAQSVMEKGPLVLQGNKQALNDLGGDLMVQTIGYDYRSKTWKVPSFTALLLAGTIASKVAGHFVKPQTFNAIPYVGKKLKL